jgi:hypothetical protein
MAGRAGLDYHVVAVSGVDKLDGRVRSSLDSHDILAVIDDQPLDAQLVAVGVGCRPPDETVPHMVLKEGTPERI